MTNLTIILCTLVILAWIGSMVWIAKREHKKRGMCPKCLTPYSFKNVEWDYVHHRTVKTCAKCGHVEKEYEPDPWQDENDYPGNI